MGLDAKLIIEKWQALELLSRLIEKIECRLHKKPLSKSRKVNEGDFHHKLIEFENLHTYDESLMAEIFSSPGVLAGARMPTNKIISLIKDAGRYNEIIVETWVLGCLLKFINYGVNKKSKAFYRIGETIPAQSQVWLPNPKTQGLVDSKWWIYHYDSIQEFNKIKQKFTKTKHGVTRSLLTLHPFGKAVIKSFNIEKISEKVAIETYLGKYKFHPKGQNHLLLEMKTETSHDRDLHIIFYVGDGGIRLAFGQYHNFSKKIYSGNLIIERIAKMKLGDASVFVDFNDAPSKKELIPEFVWRWFSGGVPNYLEVPDDISDIYL